MASEPPTGAQDREAAAQARRFPRSRVNAEERNRLREEVREVDFPIALRGYDRAAVDRYVKEVNRVIAELEITSSPEAAIRHALAEVSEETRGLLERAHETAEQITARSRARADDRLQQAEREAEELRDSAAHEAQELRATAKRETDELRETAKRETDELREMAAREAHELREEAAREAHQLRATAHREAEELRAAAEARVRELDRDADELWRERRRLIKEMSAIALQQLEIADAASARFQREAGSAAEEHTASDPPTDETLVVRDESSAPSPDAPEQP
jgi:DivIVA domain-containing protein